MPIPNEVLAFLGTPNEILLVQEEYFQTINPWMPIISTRLLRKAIHGSKVEPRADLALLLLCMKLITSKPLSSSFGSTRSNLYRSAKKLYRSIEREKRYSTHFLQSGLLISLYELGHAIYPEAQASVARNAELGVQLGIHELKGHMMNPPPSSWAEEEERSRTWWGIVILDR